MFLVVVFGNVYSSLEIVLGYLHWLLLSLLLLEAEEGMVSGSKLDLSEEQTMLYWY